MSKAAKGLLDASLKEEAERKERLRQALPAAAELLRTRQAGLIAAREIEEFIALNWLEWHGGSLRLTVTGSNVVSQSRADSSQARGSTLSRARCLSMSPCPENECAPNGCGGLPPSRQEATGNRPHRKQ